MVVVVEEEEITEAGGTRSNVAPGAEGSAGLECHE